MRDMTSSISAAQLIAAATYNADTTPVSVDRAGFGAVTIVLMIGAGGITFSGTNKIEFVMEHSSNGSSWSAVTTADLIGATVTGSGIVKSLVAAHATAATYRLGYRGALRYVRLTADFSGTHGTGTPIGAVAVLGLPTVAPVATVI